MLIHFAMNSTPPPLPVTNSLDDPRSIRKAHISHEASVKSIGVLYYLGAFCLLGFGVLGFSNEKGRTLSEQITIGMFLCAFGVLQFWTGVGLRRLRPWAKTPTGILSGIGLLGFPVGTLINAYVLYLVFSKKGATVFSPQYQAIIAATPDIKYRTSVIVWVFLGLLLAVLLAILLAVAFGK